MFQSCGERVYRRGFDVLECGGVEPGRCRKSDADVGMRADGESWFGCECGVGRERSNGRSEERPFEHCSRESFEKDGEVS